VIPFFALIGALNGGYLAKYGRRLGQIITDIIGIIGILFCFLSIYFKFI